jgi:hypothetical protein
MILGEYGTFCVTCALAELKWADGPLQCSFKESVMYRLEEEQESRMIDWLIL